MLPSAAHGDSRLSMWLRVRTYAVPPSMIELATGRRTAGDWAGACAAARIDVTLDLRSVARAHGRETAGRLRADLRRLAPDLLRWHMPRIAPDGLLRPGLTLTLARYERPGRAGPLHLVARTPPAWADAGQRIGLALWDPADPAAGHHPHPRPNRRYRLDLHRHLWDASRAGELRDRSGADAPAPPDSDPLGLAPPGHGCAVDRWAAEAAILLRAEGRSAGTFVVRLGRRRLLLAPAPDAAGAPAPGEHRRGSAPADGSAQLPGLRRGSDPADGSPGLYGLRRGPDPAGGTPDRPGQPLRADPADGAPHLHEVPRGADPANAPPDPHGPPRGAGPTGVPTALPGPPCGTGTFPAGPELPCRPGPAGAPPAPPELRRRTGQSSEPSAPPGLPRRTHPGKGAVGGGAPRLRIVGEVPAGGLSAVPVLPDAATWVVPDLELLRAGLIGADRLHPLVAAALVPGEAAFDAAGDPDPVAPARQVECRGATHWIGLVDGVLVPLDHDPDEIRREELLAALGGPPLPCLRVIDEAHRRPDCLTGVRERLDHGDTVGALAVVEALLGPGAVLREGPLRDELTAAAERRIAYGLYRAGLTGAGQTPAGQTPAGVSPRTGRGRRPTRRQNRVVTFF
ncbi:hypothetical protein [Streptomyces sp. NPDC046759]|uniref:hypothetical protein n=1 Tax=Streptomyces sp. NPDC046759 TaxID=3155019 RepID=UPI0033DDBAE9